MLRSVPIHTCETIPCPPQVEEDGEESQAAQCRLPSQQTQRYPCSMSWLLKVQEEKKQPKFRENRIPKQYIKHKQNSNDLH